MEGHSEKARYNGGLCSELCILQMSFGKPRGRLDTGHDLNEDQFLTTTSKTNYKVKHLLDVF